MGTGKGEVTALDRVSLTIRENEFFTLLGPSGCGKTTLLRLIAGFELPSDGELYLHGKRIEEPAAVPPPGEHGVSVVRPVPAPLTVHAQHRLRAGDAKAAEERRSMRRSAGCVDLVRLQGFEHRLPRELSGGQQQRVALARALAGKPEVLLLDEPLSALDLKLRREMQIELKRLQHETGITFVFVTHDQEEALTMSDRIAVMSGGKILQIGTPTEIYEQPTSRFVADFIGETNFLQALCLGSLGGRARFVLSSGDEIDGASFPGLADGAKVTLAVRPERIDLLRDTSSGVPAKLTDLLYIGNDTVCTVVLGDGAIIQVRAQNRQGAVTGLEPGAAVNLSIPADSVRVVGD